LVEEMVQPGMTVSAVARPHGVSPSLLFKWGRLMSEGRRAAVRADEDVVGSFSISISSRLAAKQPFEVADTTLQLAHATGASLAATREKPSWHCRRRSR
jgi:transposase